MRAKDYLKQIEKLDTMLKNKIIERQQWEDIALSITAQMCGERVQTSGNPQRMADAAEKCVDLEREIDETIKKLADAKSEIIATIEQLDVVEYDFLHSVYVQHNTLAEVAALKNYCYSWATTLHGKALKNLQGVLDKKMLKNV